MKKIIVNEIIGGYVIEYEGCDSIFMEGISGVLGYVERCLKTSEGAMSEGETMPKDEAEMQD